ncbi:MAG: hypothetical protein M1817_003911 [Caeruleum heppii]|nr:MAG: hypothetical protein M1817_003911 [Caeruleum heppii]
MSDPTDNAVGEAKVGLLQNVKKWGGKQSASSNRASRSQPQTRGAHEYQESPLPPTLLATLVAAQHLRPPQVVPLLFPPVLLFSTYLNLNNFVVDSAGISAAWSGLYLIMARRRKQPFTARWGVRGVVRGATMSLCLANLASGGIVYALERRKGEEEA